MDCVKNVSKGNSICYLDINPGIDAPIYGLMNDKGCCFSLEYGPRLKGY